MSKQKVRCLTCGWDGDRKTDLPLNEPHPKPCPQGHEVLVGPWLPTSSEVTPNGIHIDFWDEYRAEFPEAKQSRRYLVNGEKFTNVTRLTGLLDKPGVKYWVAELVRDGKDWEDELRKAAERGHESHQMVVDILLGKPRPLSSLLPEHRPYGQAVAAWLMKRQPKVIESERMVASLTHRYVGRFDLHAELRGVPVVPRIDFKSIRKWPVDKQTGKRKPPYAENALQIDLYEGGVRESGLPEADWGMVVRLGPDGTYDETLFRLDPSRPLSLLAVDKSVREAELALRTDAAELELAVAA